jgi:hypothetical protein
MNKDNIPPLLLQTKTRRLAAPSFCLLGQMYSPYIELGEISKLKFSPAQQQL